MINREPADIKTILNAFAHGAFLRKEHFKCQQYQCF